MLTMMLRNLISLLILFVMTQQVQAVESLEVQALMPGMVVLSIDGQRVTLKTGQQKMNVRLVASDTRQAILEVNGEQKAYRMGSAIRTSFKQRQLITEQIMRDDHGMFRAHGTINGQSVRYLVDTGASSVAMSATEARKLGIPYRLEGQPVRANTASGVSKGWAIMLKTVRLGELVEHNVRGIVIDGDYPRHVLLGMTFLNRMKVEKEGNRMTITRKQ